MHWGLLFLVKNASLFVVIFVKDDNSSLASAFLKMKFLDLR